MKMPKVVPEYKQEAKSRILRAAFQSASEKGYHETTMENIAKRLKVSKGSLYHYFNSKEELFKGICDSGIQTLREVLRSSFKSGDLIENSTEFFDKMLKQSTWNPILSLEASRSVVLRKVLKENYDNALNVVAEFLKKQREKGLIKRNVNIGSLARGLMALYDGLMVSSMIGVSEFDTRLAWKESIEAMLYGMLEKVNE